MDTAGGAQDTPLDLQVATPDGPCLWHSHPTIYAFGVHPGLRCPYYDYIKWVTWVLSHVGGTGSRGHSRGPCVWQKTADRPAYLLSSPTLADIDRSRRGPETVIGSSAGHVHVIEFITGRSLDNYPLSLNTAIHTQVRSPAGCCND